VEKCFLHNRELSMAARGDDKRFKPSAAEEAGA